MAEEIKNDRCQWAVLRKASPSCLTAPTYLSRCAAGICQSKDDGPFQGFIEALGGQVEYLPDTNEAAASISGFEIMFTVGSGTMEAKNTGEGSVVANTPAWILLPT
jgi:hypothetical protein